MISLTGVTKLYNGKRQVAALEAIDLHIARGEMVSIVGPSGSGKSTLLNLIGGLDRPTSGQIRIDGQSVADLSDDDLTRLRRDKIGFIFQFFNLLRTDTHQETDREWGGVWCTVTLVGLPTTTPTIRNRATPSVSLLARHPPGRYRTRTCAAYTTSARPVARRSCPWSTWMERISPRFCDASGVSRRTRGSTSPEDCAKGWRPPTSVGDGTHRAQCIKLLQVMEMWMIISV